MSSMSPSVAVIGAGAAGIAAATRLLENGFSDIVVLEAEPRIGGRLHSVEFGGKVVDLGGAWVHGEKGNVVFNMVKDYGLLARSHHDYTDFTYFSSDGNIADKKITDKLHEIAIEIIDDEATAKKYPGPFGDYFKALYAKRVQEQLSSSPEILELAALVERWIQKYFICLVSCPTWFDISTTGAFLYENCEGYHEWNWRGRGYKTILDVMMKKIPDSSKQLSIDDKIHVNKTVNKINWSNENIININCSDNTKYTVNHVIVTTSLGVLKKCHKTLFNPQLPTRKINAIESIPVGTINKIMLEFSKPWWPSEFKGISFFWTDEDKKNLTKELPPESSCDWSWLQDLYGFYRIDCNPNVLLGWIVGKHVEEVETLSDEVVLKGSMWLLKRFAGNNYDVTQAKNILRSKWKTSKNFHGSYSYMGLEMEKCNASANDLAEPLSKNGKPLVSFAGEATNSTHFSTVHGAVETGYREADRIIKLYKE